MACTRDLVFVIRVKAGIPGDALMSANGTSPRPPRRTIFVAIGLTTDIASF